MAKQGDMVLNDAKAMATGNDESSALIRMAIDKNLDVDKLERLIALKERADAAAAKSAFFTALTKLQNKLPVIPKKRAVNRTGGGLLYKFADLADVTAAIRSLEQEYGFAHRFEFATSEKGACEVTCCVTHVGGHSERTTVSIAPTKGNNTNPAQDNGIQMTYGQRYALCGAYGVTTGVDTDAHVEADPNAPKPEYITMADRNEIGRLITLYKLTREEVCKMAGVEQPQDILKADLAALKAKMEKNRNA